MEERQITPVHLYTDYDEYYAAIESVKADVLPLPFAWQFVESSVGTFNYFCEFVNNYKIENWVFDDGSRFSMRFRTSQFKRAASEAGLASSTSFRLR